MSSSTSCCSSTRSPRPPSTTHTSPDRQDKLHNQQGAPFKGQPAHNSSSSSSPNDATITFEKRDIVALKPNSPPPSTFSSFSPTNNIDNASTSNNTSSSSNIKHFHGLSTSCECDEPPSLHSRVATPASTLPPLKDEQIGTHLPFDSSSSSAEKHHHPAFLTKSRSMISVPTLPATRLLSDDSSPPMLKPSTVKKSNYKPAKHVLRPKSPPTVHSRKPEMRLVFTSEEEARQAAILRNNYSLPPSPGSRSATGSSGLLTPQPRRQLGEPRTPLYMPAAVLRRPQQVQTAQETTGDSYFTEFAHSPGPPTKSHWKPDTSRNACAQCSRMFTLFERRHHCRRCGDIFCALHSRFKVDLDSNVAFNPFSGVSSKACMSCSIEYQEFKRSYLEPAPSPTQHENMMIPTPIVSGASPSNSHAGHDNLSSSQFGSSVQNSVPADWQWSTF